jgi:hypothetical protein
MVVLDSIRYTCLGSREGRRATVKILDQIKKRTRLGDIGAYSRPFKKAENNNHKSSLLAPALCGRLLIVLFDVFKPLWHC